MQPSHLAVRMILKGYDDLSLITSFVHSPECALPRFRCSITCASGGTVFFGLPHRTTPFELLMSTQSDLVTIEIVLATRYLSGGYHDL